MASTGVAATAATPALVVVEVEAVVEVGLDVVVVVGWQGTGDGVKVGVLSGKAAWASPHAPCSVANRLGAPSEPGKVRAPWSVVGASQPNW